MSNLVLSRVGQINNTGAVDAQFLEVFTGEVMTAFDEVNIMKDLHRTRTIEHGKSASFPIIGKANARYHTAGTPILGANQIPGGLRTINIDNLLISDVAIYDLEDAMLHYDVRGEYSKQLGVSLAREFDQKTMRIGVLAARGAGIIADEAGGSVIKGGATVATDGKVLTQAIFSCAELFDTKDVPDIDRSLIVRPAQYYLLVQNLDLQNKDVGGTGLYLDGKVIKCAGISIYKSNHVPSTNVTQVKDGEKNDYTGDFTDTVALALHRDAMGTVKLKDLAVQKSGEDFNIMYQATLMVAKYAMGHGILRPSCAIEISKATA